MRRIFRKIKQFFRTIGAIFYLIFYRIKFSGQKRGVAQVVDSFNSGGLEQVAANVYKAFKDNGDVSAVISVSNNVGPMCQQLYTPGDLRIVYYDGVEMLKYCARKNIGTLIYHFSTFHMIFFKLLGFKNYYVIHNTYIWYTKKEWKALKFKLHFTNGIIAVSEWCKNYFVKKTGINDIKVILNGIDFDNLDKGEKSEVTRDSLKLKDTDIVCLTIGGYTDGKHQMALLGIAEEVHKKNKNIKFISAGPVLDKKIFEKYNKSILKMNLKGIVIPLTYIPQEQIGDFILNVCDIYLQPSIHEAGVPLTVMEALIKGKPVIMTDFLIEKTFPNVSRIKGIKPPYDSVLDITPLAAHTMSLKTKDRSTKDFIDSVLEMASELNNIKSKPVSREDYQFLSRKRMSQDYIDYIKL